MKAISNFTSAFNINKTSSYHLSLQIGHFGYSDSMIDTIRRQYIALKHAPLEATKSDTIFYDQIKDAIKSDTFLSKNFKSVDFIFVSRKSTLVPSVYFDKSNLKKMVELNFQIADYEEIHFNKIKNPDAYNVFTIPSYITTLMVNAFPEVRFYHQSTSLIESNLLRSDTGAKTRFALNIYDDFVDILGVKNSKLLFNTTNYYQTGADLVYIITNAMKQLNLKPADVEIEL